MKPDRLTASNTAGQADTASMAMGAVFESSPNPYVLLTPDLRIVAVNRAYEEVTGANLSLIHI